MNQIQKTLMINAKCPGSGPGPPPRIPMHNGSGLIEGTDSEAMRNVARSVDYPMNPMKYEQHREQ